MSDLEYARSYFDELEHHGVKGQKWGVRRQLKKEARQKRKADKKAAKATKRANAKPASAKRVIGRILGGAGGALTLRAIAGNTDLAFVKGASAISLILGGAGGATLVKKFQERNDDEDD